VYALLAKAQRTKIAVTPVHTQKEFELFAKAVLPGGEWCTQNKPQFEGMACWWSAHADGKAVLYKLPEHLATYYAKFSDTRLTHQTMVESQPHHQRNQMRIHSHGHHSKVLPAIEIHNISRAAVSATESESLDMMALDISYSHHSTPTPTPSDESIMDIDNEPIASSSSMPLDNTGTLSGQLGSAAGSAADALNLLHPSANRKRSKKSKKSHAASDTSSTNFITGASIRAKRKCKVCESTGRDGSDCPGSGGRSKCQFL